MQPITKVNHLKLFDPASIQAYLESNQLPLTLKRRKRSQSYPIKIEKEEKELLKRISDCSQSLLQLIQTACAKEEFFLIISKNQLKEHFFSVSCYKDLIFENPAIATIFAKIFTDLLQVSLEIKKDRCRITWQKDNPYLQFKPNLFDCAKVQQQHGFFCYNHRMHADIIFEVEGQEIAAHQLFVLERCPYFKGYLHTAQAFENGFQSKIDSFEENPKRIEFKGASFSVFHSLIFFCYTSSIKEENKTAKHISDLYQLANLVLFDDLIQYCRYLIPELMTIENFLTFAFLQAMFEDKELEQLFEWNLTYYYDLNKLNISHFNAEQTFQAFFWTRKYCKTILDLKYMTKLIEEFSLQITPAALLDILREKSDLELKEWYFENKN